MLLQNAESFAAEIRLLLLKAKESGNLVTIYGGTMSAHVNCPGRVVDVTAYTVVLECQELDGEDVMISRFHAAIHDLVAVDVYQTTFKGRTLKTSSSTKDGDQDTVNPVNQ